MREAPWSVCSIASLDAGRSSKKESDSAAELEVLGGALLAQHVERKNVVAKVHLERHPVAQEYTHAGAGVHRQVALTVELRAAKSGNQVQRRDLRGVLPDEHLARKNVPAGVHGVV